MGTFMLPDLGEGLAEAEIVEWHVTAGDRVRVDQPMVSVETAKAVVEVPVPFSGTVTALRGAVGDILATGAPLIDFDADCGTVVGVMPSANGEDFAAHLGAGAAGPARGTDPHRARAVPMARALANHLGLELGSIATGPDGIVRLDDVLTHVIPATPGRGAGPLQAAAPAPAGSTVEPLRGARRAMAQSMSTSRDQVAGSTVFDDADIQAWKGRGDYMLRLIRAMGHACGVEPALNAWYDASTRSRVLLPQLDLAIAVDTPGGLVVPVLRDVRQQTAEELRSALAAHTTAARERKLAPEDLRDFTLTLSNFGSLAGRYGIPLVVPPAVAILGAGKVNRDAVVVGDAVVAHRCMPLSLSFDHRCVTGGEACRFLAAVIDDLQKPD